MNIETLSTQDLTMGPTGQFAFYSYRDQGQLFVSITHWHFATTTNGGSSGWRNTPARYRAEEVAAWTAKRMHIDGDWMMNEHDTEAFRHYAAQLVRMTSADFGQLVTVAPSARFGFYFLDATEDGPVIGVAIDREGTWVPSAVQHFAVTVTAMAAQSMIEVEDEVLSVQDFEAYREFASSEILVNQLLLGA